MSRLRSLKKATTVVDLAALLGFKPAAMTYILYVKPSNEKYRSFEIPKKAGGTRTICAPTSELKLLQRNLAVLLQDCLEEIEASQGHTDDSPRPDRISHGFKRRRSIITNAKRHKNRRFVFNTDIQNFFGSINFGRVRGYFMADHAFELSPRMSTLLAQIACHDNALPQGSPCSPVISNLIGHIFDMHLVHLAASNGCVYSRYADDLTFSTNRRTFPDAVATCVDCKKHEWEVGSNLSRIIERSGFRINAAKTRMQYRGSRQVVTGLVTNKVINVRSDYRRAVRAMVHTLLKTGEFYYQRTLLDENGSPTQIRYNGTPEQLAGMLYFIYHVDSMTNQNASWTKTRTIRSFLVFQRFYRAELPILVCEGKTDIVYLTHAIRSMAKQFPNLATVTDSGDVELRIRRFRYKGRSTNSVLGLHGGTGDINKFISLYSREVAKFIAPGMLQPVIVLIDNDAGLKDINKTIKKLTKKSLSRQDQFAHVCHNLYVVPTPLQSGSDSSKIEDSFSADTLSTRIGIRRFNASNEYNPKSEYGKADFAYKVVARYANTIDFSGFNPLLDRLSQVIDHHRSMVDRTYEGASL